MSQPILITAAQEDSAYILSRLAPQGVPVLHAPLEVYRARTDDEDIAEVIKRLNSFQNVVVASKRNARFFCAALQRFNRREAAKKCLTLAFDKPTFNYLEEQGIAAVNPPAGCKAIDVLELMLRLKRMGKTLYPCGSHRREDLPGLLEELDIPVTELSLFDLQGPSEKQLQMYQQKVSAQPPGTVIFHSRRSVNRTLAAFPDLDYENARVISADKAISNKLKKKGMGVDDEAEGNWKSIAKLI